MKALILRKDGDAAIATGRALIDKGFQILCVDTLSVAHALIRVDTIDLLVMDEKVEGQLTHAIALSGERRNPYLSAIFLTDRSAEETDDLYALIPSLYAMVGTDIDPSLLGKLALSSVSNVEDIAARVAAYATETTAVEKEIEALVLDNALAAPEDELEMLVLDTTFAVPEDASDVIAPAYADVAVAAPVTPEIIAPEDEPELEKVEDVVMAEVAAMFRTSLLPRMAQMHRHAAAQPT